MVNYGYNLQGPRAIMKLYLDVQTDLGLPCLLCNRLSYNLTCVHGHGKPRASDKTFFSTKKYIFIFFLISPGKHMLWVLIRGALQRHF